MFMNFQYLTNSTYGKDFSCIYTDENNTEWHVQGKRNAGESDFKCDITLRSQVSNPDPILQVRGIDGIHALIQVTARVARWNNDGEVGYYEEPA